MTAIDTGMEGIEELRGSMQGDVVLPGEGEWDLARQAWNLAVDQRPAAVAFPENADDVVAVVRFARERGLQVAPQGTGHSAGPLGALDGTILLKTSRMSGVEIDAPARRAHAQAGALWADVTVPAAEHGLAALAGSSPDVGVVGYTVGGGIGWLARRHGLSAGAIRSAEVVTGEGTLVQASPDGEAELLWALRGGGGSFGVVTRMELKLFEVPTLYAGDLFFPMDRAAEVLHRWREWIRDVPDEVSSLGRLLQLPPLPDIPEHLRGRSFVLVEAACCCDEERGAELVAPLRELGPELDTLATIRPPELAGLHMDPPQPVPGAGDGMLLADFPAEAVDALVEAAGPGSGSPLLSLEVRQLGGALDEGSPDDAALHGIDAGFAVFGVGMVVDESVRAAIYERLDLVQSALAPWEAGRTYMNFKERSTEPGKLFSPEVYERLLAAKRRYDPDGVIRANHPVG